jgi:hypothetical protein
MTDSEFTLIRATNNTGPITMGTTDTATTIMWMNIGGTNGSGGTGTIIDTITIEIMIGTASGIACCAVGSQIGSVRRRENDSKKKISLAGSRGHTTQPSVPPLLRRQTPVIEEAQSPRTKRTHMKI